METLDGLKRRIATTDDLKAIVRTMKTLSAVSIRQFERATDSLRRFDQTLEQGLQILARSDAIEIDQHSLEPSRAIFVVFGSDRGLCGRFNRQVVDFALEKSQAMNGPQTEWVAVGERVNARLAASGIAMLSQFNLPGSVDGLADFASSLVVELTDWQSEQNPGRVVLVFNRRSQGNTGAPCLHLLLPLDPQWLDELAHRPWPQRSLPTFTMDAPILFADLVRQFLYTALFRAGAESLASEHASRLATLQAAERNIADRLDTMQSAFRQRRQDTITTELLDVVSGFEAIGAADRY